MLPPLYLPYPTLSIDASEILASRKTTTKGDIIPEPGLDPNVHANLPEGKDTIPKDSHTEESSDYRHRRATMGNTTSAVLDNIVQESNCACPSAWPTAAAGHLTRPR